MSARVPTPSEADAAIAQAARAAAPVRTEDRLFAVRLFTLAISVVALSIVIVLIVATPAWLGPLQGAIAMLALAAAVLLVLAAERRQHAFTRAGNRLFTATLGFWLVWAEVVWQFSTHSDWLSFAQPRPARAAHFVLTAVLAVIPLLAGAVVFRFRR